ncbi:hypothetical protein HanPI659440_Chr06g0245041 [Helianthus annuus]|nr:hypothetical protein HanPI659440_Chr06g0245041 [Helianthus annuus]
MYFTIVIKLKQQSNSKQNMMSPVNSRGLNLSRKASFEGRRRKRKKRSGAADRKMQRGSVSYSLIPLTLIKPQSNLHFYLVKLI